MNDSDIHQIIQAVEEKKASIVQLGTDITEAKHRQDEATKSIKTIERDMRDFENNKDSKLVELQVSSSKIDMSGVLILGRLLSTSSRRV